LYALGGNFVVPAMLFIIGLLYSKGIKIKDRKVRLKAGYGMKNAVVGFAWGSSIACSLEKFDSCVLAFFFAKLFINSAFFDLKDVEKDKIPTLPLILGEKFRLFLGIAAVLLHSLAFLHYRNLIVVFSFVLSQTAILMKEDTGRKIIDFEPALSVFLYLLYLFCQNSLLHS
jgi:4-hydroxybenzoate polyprenyltransferase